jgi:hypothetical protein
MSTSSLLGPSFQKSHKSIPTAGLPWGTLVVSIVLTLYTCAAIGQWGSFFRTLNEFLTASVLIAATAGVVFYPWQTVRIFLCLYLALRLLTMTGLIGYATASYIALVITLGLARKLHSIRKSIPEFPGTGLMLAFAALVTLQFFRATSPHDALPILCDVIAFAVAIWKFGAIPEQSLRKCVEGFILGVLAAGLILFLYSSQPESRLGSEFGFNPNDLGYLAGAALLFAISCACFKRRRWLLWSAIPLLVVLLVASQSRTSVFACATCVGVFVAVRKRRVFLALLLCGSIVLGYFTYHGTADGDPESLSGRLASPFTESFEDSGAHRAVIWGFLLTQVPNYWKLGLGLRNVNHLTEEYGLIPITDALSNRVVGYQSHNMYLTALLEFGILGLILLVAWQARVLVFVVKEPSRYSLLLAALLYFLIQGFFEGLNLDFVSGFLLAAAYSIGSGSQCNQKKTRTA